MRHPCETEYNAAAHGGTVLCFGGEEGQADCEVSVRHAARRTPHAYSRPCQYQSLAEPQGRRNERLLFAFPFPPGLSQ